MPLLDFRSLWPSRSQTAQVTTHAAVSVINYLVHQGFNVSHRVFHSKTICWISLTSGPKFTWPTVTTSRWYTSTATAVTYAAPGLDRWTWHHSSMLTAYAVRTTNTSPLALLRLLISNHSTLSSSFHCGQLFSRTLLQQYLQVTVQWVTRAMSDSNNGLCLQTTTSHSMALWH